MDTDPLAYRELAEEAIAGQRLMHEQGTCSCGQIGTDGGPDIGCVLLAEVERLRDELRDTRAFAIDLVDRLPKVEAATSEQRGAGGLHSVD